MQGKTQFTGEQIKVIKDLLYDLRRADRDTQKVIRRKMRRLGFYITDFGERGCSTADLNDLNTSGQIKVTD